MSLVCVCAALRRSDLLDLVVCLSLYFVHPLKVRTSRQQGFKKKPKNEKSHSTPSTVLYRTVQ